MSKVSDSKKNADIKKELKDLKEFLAAVVPILDILEMNPILLEAIMRGDMTDLDVIKKVEKVKKNKIKL